MKILRRISLALLLLLALNALVAGYLLMSDPSGSRLGMSVQLLKYSSFTNFFIPGLVLFTVNGVFALITALSLYRVWPFCAFWLCCQGMLLCGWILIQIILIRQFNNLQGLMGLMGLFFIAAGLLMLRKK